jgi:diguanylate cyclase (GGDEF)-like protein
MWSSAFIGWLFRAGSALIVVAMLAASAIVATGRRRKRQWITGIGKIRHLEGLKQEEQLERIERAQRAGDFLNDSLRRGYCAIGAICALILISLPFLPVERAPKLMLSLGLMWVEFMGALLLLWHWRTAGEGRESLLWKEVRRAQEAAHARRGLSVRDDLTGVYTLDYWLHSLESTHSGFLRRPLPITALMLEITGLGELRAVRGDRAAEDVVLRASQELTRNVRASDLVCRYRGQRFAVALLRCPTRYSEMVAGRVSSNITRLVLQGTNSRLGSSLSVQWAVATMPGHAASPIQLLRLSESSLDLKRSLTQALQGSPAGD